MNSIPIFLASDDKYSPFIATTITSIIKNTESFINFYILDGGIKNVNRKKIESLTEKFNNFSVEFLSMKDYGLERFPNVKHYSINTFSRYFIPELKPTLDKILYMDVDIIVKGDIFLLYSQDLENYPLGAVLEDFYPENYTYLNQTFPKYKGGTNYFNAGVLIINLDYFRKNNTTQTLIDKTIELNNKLNCPDQDILNLTFENNFKILDYKFNCMPDHTQYITQLGKKEAVEAIKNPIVIHYTGEKPWKNILAEKVIDFWEIAKLTPFYDELKNQFNSSYKTNMKILNKKILKYQIWSKIFTGKKQKKYINKLISVQADLKKAKDTKEILAI